MDSSTIAPQADPRINELSRSLKSRHVSMIIFGGIIGGGLFVGSSITISNIGPAAVLSYALAGFLVLRVTRMMALSPTSSKELWSSTIVIASFFTAYFIKKRVSASIAIA